MLHMVCTATPCRYGYARRHAAAADYAACFAAATMPYAMLCLMPPCCRAESSPYLTPLLLAYVLRAPRHTPAHAAIALLPTSAAADTQDAAA